MSKALREFQAALHKQAEYKSQAQKFYELMKEEWQYVRYDEKRESGEVRAGLLGKVEFHESGSDPAVVVWMKDPIRIKASAEDAAKAMEKIAAILNDIGV